jgi:hypothetical protein
LPFPFALAFFPFAGAGADGFCDTTGPDGRTGDVVEVDDVELVPLEVGCVEVVVGGAAGAHDSVIDTTGSFTGNEIDDNGVPAGTDNDNTCPPNNVTLTAHESAEADGNAARPERPSADAAPAAATTSFRVLNTVAYLLPAVRLSLSSVPRPPAAPIGRYLLRPGFATANCVEWSFAAERSVARDRAPGSELVASPASARGRANCSGADSCPVALRSRVTLSFRSRLRGPSPRARMPDATAIESGRSHRATQKADAI